MKVKIVYARFRLISSLQNACQR